MNYSPAWLRSEPTIDYVFARCIRAGNRAMLFFLVFAGISLIGGILFSLNEKEDIRIPGMISTLLCVLMFGGIGLYMLANPADQRFAKIRALLRDYPEQLVWSYILEQRTNGIPTWFVVMCFRDGKQIHIHRRSFPDKDMQGFISMLSRLNPRMHIGYTDERKKMFKAKQM